MKLRAGPSVLKEPWALKVSFVMLWCLSYLGQSGQGSPTLATHCNHLGSFRNHWCFCPTSQRFQYNWSGVLAGYEDFLKVPDNWKEQPVLRARERCRVFSMLPCWLILTLIHPDFLPWTPAKQVFLVMHLRKWLADLNSRLFHLFPINVINLVWVPCCKEMSCPWAAYRLSVLALALSLLHVKHE